jgi:hypothetical protein
VSYPFAVVFFVSITTAWAQVGASGAAGAIPSIQLRPGDPASGPPSQAQQQMPQQQQQTPATFEGSVVNAITGEPLKRANLILMPMQPGPNAATPYSTVSDANGHFAMSNIAPGSYRLMADRTGYVRTDYGSSGPGRPGTALTFAAGQAMKEIAVRMQPHAVIAGRVLDEDGDPLAGVQVQALSQRYVQGRKQLMPSSSSSTNDLGEYRIFGLAPGKYYVNAVYRSNTMAMGTVDRTANPNSTIQDEGYAPTYYPGTHDTTSAVPVPVAAGQPLTNVDFTLRRTRTVRVKGKIRGPNSQGRSMVMLLQQNDVVGMGSRNMSTTQGADGAFEIRGVTPGAYTLVAQQSDQNVQYIGRLPLNVGNSNIENIELVVSPGMPVTGRVRVEGDTQVNLGTVMISLQPKEFGPFGGAGSSMVNPDGTFSIPNVSPNTYRINAGMRGSQPVYVKSVQVGEQYVPSRELSISEGAAPPITVVLSAATAQVSGQVTADSAKSNTGALVVLIPAADKRDQVELFRTATTDQYGKFTLKAIAPGEYTVYAWDQVEPGAWLDPEFLAKFETKGKSVTVKDNESATADIPLLKMDDGQ